MKYRIHLGHEPLILKIVVATKAAQPIHLIVEAEGQPNTVFTDRVKTVVGEETLYVRMPLSPETALVTIFNERNGDRKDDSFSVVSMHRQELERKLDDVDLKDKNVRSFIKFAQKFCYNAGWLKPGVYKSDDERFFIRYEPVLYMVDQNGQRTNHASSTPARIGEETGIMEAAQKYMVPLTVPGRFLIMCHEFSHIWANEKQASEVEADLNGLLIYLGLGYPRIEAYQTFEQILMKVPSEENKRRLMIIHKFITDFENNNFVVYEQ